MRAQYRDSIESRERGLPASHDQLDFTTVPVLSLGAPGPQTISTQNNPLGPVSVAAGTYTMTEGNPSGYQLRSGFYSDFQLFAARSNIYT